MGFDATEFLAGLFGGVSVSGSNEQEVISEDGPAAVPSAPTRPRPRSAAPVPAEWLAAAADFVLLLAPDDLPPVPFRLNAWTEIRDAGKFLRWLRADILRGPTGPRARLGTLQADLLELQRFVLQAHD